MIDITGCDICQNSVCEHTAAELNNLRARIARLEEALQEVAATECHRDDTNMCRDVAPTRPGKWCLSCIARAALEVGKP